MSMLGIVLIQPQHEIKLSYCDKNPGYLFSEDTLHTMWCVGTLQKIEFARSVFSGTIPSVRHDDPPTRVMIKPGAGKFRVTTAAAILAENASVIANNI